MKIVENIATPMAPVYRQTLISPLTCQAIRRGRDGSFRTLLDSMLSDQEAEILEEFADCELLLRGNCRTTDYCGDRVQKGRSAMAPIADRDMQRLASHARLKRQLDPETISTLRIFCLQQWREPGAPSDAEMGLLINPRARNASQEWRRCLVSAVKRLAR